ncbi:MAG: spore germination protein GerW family protein [Ruminococcus sp.]|jgi:sporulation protein YtfJ|nr:sporulation protein YtfJ [Ruminococcus sp.]MDD7338168.1 spore germination protein GerW family protein [Ruminococcus sp.]
MKEQSAAGILGTTIDKIKDMVDSRTIIGDPIDAGQGIKVIPVSKVTYGFASGGSDFPSKSAKELFGGGGGAGVTLTPVAFLVINNGSVSVKYISEGPDSSMERVISSLPELVDKLSEVVDKIKNKKNGEEEFDVESVFEED